MEQTKQKRYDLEKTFKEKLKLFFMIVRPGNIPAIPKERAIGVIAYRPEEAIKKGTEDFAPDKSGLVAIWKGDYVEMEELMKGAGMMKQEVSSQPQPKPTRKPMGKDKFKWSLQLAKDEYLTSQKDKKDLERIIKKI